MISRASSRAIRKTCKIHHPEPRIRKYVPPTRTMSLKGNTLTITIDGVPASYLIEELPTDFGRAWKLTKTGTSTKYTIFCDESGSFLCDCPAGIGERLHCKHADALAALIKLGRI